MKVFNETVPWRLVIIGLRKALSCFRPQKKYCAGDFRLRKLKNAIEYNTINLLLMLISTSHS